MGGQLIQIIKSSKMLVIDQVLVFLKTPLVQGIHLPISIQLAHSMAEVLEDVMPHFIKSVQLLQIGKQYILYNNYKTCNWQHKK